MQRAAALQSARRHRHICHGLELGWPYAAMGGNGIVAVETERAALNRVAGKPAASCGDAISLTPVAYGRWTA